ncbi:MAG: hypothetical protein U0470_12755 [Anaerolineae bacterium]
MGPADRAAVRQREHVVHVDRGAGGAQAVDDRDGPFAAVVADRAEERLEGRIVDIDEVAEDVVLAPFVLGAHLDPGDDPDADVRAGRARGRDGVRRVVVRDRQHREAAARRERDELGRGEGAVGSRGMGV